MQLYCNLMRQVLVVYLETTKGDNYNVIKHLQGSVGRVGSNVDIGKAEDLSFLKDFGNFIFHFANRNCNKLVDFCANFALFGDFFREDLGCNNVPHAFLSLLKEDCDSTGPLFVVNFDSIPAYAPYRGKISVNIENQEFATAKQLTYNDGGKDDILFMKHLPRTTPRISYTKI
ncbi:hypothetical protein M5K25_013457 [Dendrobium thyrsiflorum]|uniref:Uncharacterized protein n=1 Tax=Dendrobium thyrsiflorum TaxID=117978 RepID=A0ABD0UTU6_DENTH